MSRPTIPKISVLQSEYGDCPCINTMYRRPYLLSYTLMPRCTPTLVTSLSLARSHSHAHTHAHTHTHPITHARAFSVHTLHVHSFFNPSTSRMLYVPTLNVKIVYIHFHVLYYTFDDAEYHAVGNRNILIIIPNIWESLGSTLSLSLARTLSPSLSIYSCLLLLSTSESGIEK